MGSASLSRTLNFRPQLEALEGRDVPSSPTFMQTNLVSDQAGMALKMDPNLVNPWGMAVNPMGAIWVSDNQTGVATLYQGDLPGVPFSINPLVVDGLGNPTGQVFNPTGDFVIHNAAGTQSGKAVFIFVSEDGTITGWNPGVGATAPRASTHAQLATSVSGAVFKGVALANNTIGTHTGNFLYVADFHSGHILVYDGQFHLTELDGSFTDPKLPKGYAPFNIQFLNGMLYVTYAKQDATMHDDVPGHGRGFVDIFDTDGHLVKRLIKRGELNAPWGMAIAPATWGRFAGALLVGNFGDGRIHAYNPLTGHFLGTLRDTHHHPITIDGLWGLTFGNGVATGTKDTLFFTAGPNDEMHGLFGTLTLVSTGQHHGHHD
jgi:uncharacterized protein (TIGR03118 family)